MSLEQLGARQSQAQGVRALAVGSVMVTWPESSSHAVETPAAKLAGITVEGPTRAEISVLITRGAYTTATVDADLALPLQGAANGVTAHYAVEAPRSAGADLEACQQLVMDASLDRAQAAEALCERLEQTLAALRRGAVRLASGPKRFGSDEGAWELYVAALPEGLGAGRLRIVAKAGVPAVRMVELRLGDAWRLEVLISPLGEPMSGRLIRRYLPGAEQAASLFEQDELYFDQNFGALTQRTRSFGDRAHVRHAVQQWRHGGADNLSETDGELRGMIVDGALDVRLESLLPHLLLRAAPAQNFSQGGRLAEALFTPLTEESVLEAAWGLTDGWDEGGGHGTGVAGIVAAGLPRAKLSLLSISGPEWVGEVQPAVHAIIRKIEIDRPKVVNISAAFQDDVVDCEALWGRVFTHFADSVLFVVAAGNDGMRDPTHVCPGSLSSAHANVISVAGVTAQGRLHAESNYGAGVDIAAPHCADVKVMEGGQAVVRQACGTSFAAPAVAHAALRMLASEPAIKPAQLKFQLMAQCVGPAIPVGCGGAIATRAEALLIRP